MTTERKKIKNPLLCVCVTLYKMYILLIFWKTVFWYINTIEHLYSSKLFSLWKLKFQINIKTKHSNSFYRYVGQFEGQLLEHKTNIFSFMSL